MLHTLYVDDEPALTEIARIFLERSGSISVDTAVSAHDALEMLEQNDYDVIVADYQMPEMDGLALLKEMSSRNVQIPFILFTGRGREEVAIEALNNGVTFYLQKGGNPKAQFAELQNMIFQAAQHRHMEKQLALAQFSIERGSDEVFWTDLRGRFIYVNDAACRSLGYSREELLQMQISDIDAAFGPENLQSVIRKLECDGGVLFQSYHRRKDRTLFPVEMNFNSIKFGNDAYIFAFCRDITERVRAQERLQETTQRLADIISFLPDATFVVDRNGSVIAWNRALEVMTGIPATEMVGKGNYEYALPFYGSRRPLLIDLVLRWDEKNVSLYDTIRKEGRTLIADKYIPRLNGGRGVHLWFTASPLCDAKGDLVGAIESIRDITPLKSAQENLLKTNLKLNLLSSVMRHDIRNRLFTLRGLTRILIRRVSDPSLVDMLMKQDRAAVGICRQVDFSGMYNELGAKGPEWQDLRFVIEKAASKMDMPAVSLEVPDAGICVYSDPLLEQVFVNLIDNSLRHGDHVSRIRIRCERNGGEYCIVYEDNGTGIPEEDKERIFDLYFGKNTGHGLFLVREILAATGLIIRETGESGTGARFEILIPENSCRIRKEESDNGQLPVISVSP